MIFSSPSFRVPYVSVRSPGRCGNQSLCNVGRQAQAAGAVLCGMRSLWPLYSAVHSTGSVPGSSEGSVLRNRDRLGPCHQGRQTSDWHSAANCLRDLRGNHGRQWVMMEWISVWCVSSVPSAHVWSLSISQCVISKLRSQISSCELSALPQLPEIYILHSSVIRSCCSVWSSLHWDSSSLLSSSPSPCTAPASSTPHFFWSLSAAKVGIVYCIAGCHSLRPAVSPHVFGRNWIYLLLSILTSLHGARTKQDGWAVTVSRWNAK